MVQTLPRWPKRCSSTSKTDENVEAEKKTVFENRRMVNNEYYLELLRSNTKKTFLWKRRKTIHSFCIMIMFLLTYLYWRYIFWSRTTPQSCFSYGIWPHVTLFLFQKLKKTMK
uniref:Uncharacterized protein n=1 Tax=Lepeophtheirus salmonis TaxID=72036 RepID=A0A0K2TKY2_LEPSM